jgi:hypothetical protein
MLNYQRVYSIHIKLNNIAVGEPSSLSHQQDKHPRVVYIDHLASFHFFSIIVLLYLVDSSRRES